MIKTKIICTLGPSSSSISIIKKLIYNGMSIVRFNFSHGTHSFYEDLMHKIKICSKETNKTISVIQDLQGPKIRTGKMKNDAIVLIKNNLVKIVTDEIIGNQNLFSIQYDNLIKDIHPLNIIVLSDGKIILKCINKTDKYILCKVIIGGVLANYQGVNFPNRQLPISSLTSKDYQDLKFGLRIGVHAIALSFVRSYEDIIDLKKKISYYKKPPLIISKIETQLSITKNIYNIIKVSDGIMIARGDLAIETTHHIVPIIQKKIINIANKYNTITIVATQILDSMIQSPIPTRAEISDIANAVIDGSDMLMLSGETSIGKFPIESVLMIYKTILMIEKKYLKLYYSLLNKMHITLDQIQCNNFILSVMFAAKYIKNSIIITFGLTLIDIRLISKYRPKSYVIALVKNEHEYYICNFMWGIQSEIINNITFLNNVLNNIKDIINNKYKSYNNKTIILLIKKENFEIHIYKN